MQFSHFTLAAVLSTLALAAPAPQTTSFFASENITVTEFSLRKFDAGISYVDFKLSGDDATDLSCNASNPAFPSEVITCGDSKYRFALWTGNATEYALRLYHELGTGFGFYGEADVPTYCHAGGSSTDDFICAGVVDPLVITIGA